MEHVYRAITHTAQDVEVVAHPSVTDEVKVRKIPGSEVISNTAYGCKVCGLSMAEILENNTPCMGVSLEAVIDGALADSVDEG